MKTEILAHEFSVGGKWKYTMEMPDGDQFIAEGTYARIDKFKEISSIAYFKPMTEGVEIQSLFEENGDKTHFTFNVIHPTEASRIQQEKMGILNGWGAVFERLDQF